MDLSLVYQVRPKSSCKAQWNGEEDKADRKRGGIQHQKMDGSAVQQVPVGSGEQRKMEETGCEIICGAPITPLVKGQMKVKDPDHDRAIQSFHKTMQHLVVCHQTKSSCKRINSSDWKYIRSYFDPSLWPCPWKQPTNLYEWQSGSWWCTTISNLVVKGSAVQMISSGKPLTFWSSVVTLTLKTTIQFLHKTLRLMIMYHQTKFGSKRVSNSEDIVKPLVWPWPWK